MSEENKTLIEQLGELFKAVDNERKLRSALWDALQDLRSVVKYEDMSSIPRDHITPEVQKWLDTQPLARQPDANVDNFISGIDAARAVIYSRLNEEKAEYE